MKCWRKRLSPGSTASFAEAQAMHEARVDFCMLLGLITILCIGGGQISCDAKRFMGGE